jgi:hypothetical protein
MVPKLHAKGSSFKGAAAYLLHDKDRAKTDERVAWAETRNLATDNPHVAWKVMAATAMDQQRLKEQAGVKKTGRKSYDAVLHFTLSWHPEEKDGLSREEMTRAAHQAIRALNASDRQAMIVCHDDEPQPHIHVLINRVSFEDGRMLSSSKEKLALSKWAEAYEKERGFVYCEERVINNEARKRGEYTRGQKDKARNIFELEAANDNAPDAKAIAEAQRRKEAALARRARELKARQRQASDEFQKNHKQRIKEIKAETLRERAAAIDAVREKRRPDWTMLFHEHQAQLRDFEKREESLKGRLKNFFGSIDLKAAIYGSEELSRKQAISEVFSASDAGKRLAILQRRQEADKRKLQAQQKQEERQAAATLGGRRQEGLQKNRQVFERERNDLILTQSMDGAKLRAERKTRREEREAAWTSRASGGRAPEQEREKSFKPDNVSELPERDQAIRELEERLERKRSRQRDQERD